MKDWCVIQDNKELTHAVISTIDLHVVRGTNASVVAHGVVASSRPTDAFCETLINICKTKDIIRGYIQKTNIQPKIN